MLLRPFAEFLSRLRESMRHSKRKSQTFPVAEFLEHRILPANTAIQVADIFSGTGDSSPKYLTTVNGMLYFSAKDSAHGAELWKSNGTAEGTVIVKDITAGSVSSDPKFLTNLNGTLYFSVHDGVHGYELWKSDGTDAGTVLVKDIRSGAASSFISYLSNVNGTLYFSADDGVHGSELWKSDGTADGTMLVKDINPGAGEPDLRNFTAVNGLLYFTADDGVHGTELWKTNGTEAGTVLVKDSFAGTNTTNGNPNSASPASLTNVNGTLYFTASGTSSEYELWKSNGTEAGTVLVKDINSVSDSYGASYLTNVNGVLYFGARNSDGGGQLWKSSGTSDGTVIVKEFKGNSYYGVSYITNVNGTIFFTAGDRSGSAELWKSNGTAGGTTLVKNLYPGAMDFSLYQLTNVGGILYFAADSGSAGTELWQSDGTASGTALVKDIFPGESGSNPDSFTNVNGVLYFRARTPGAGKELWRISDGNVAPTGISLSSTTIGDHSAPNSTVGSLSATDANSGEAFTFDLVAGTGSTDNSSFSIAGRTLKLIPSSDLATQSSYSIRIRVTDHGGLSFEKQFTISVTQVSSTTPVLTLNSAPLVYHVSGRKAVAVDAAATIAANDGMALNFNGATLQVSGHSSKETVSILKQGGIALKGKSVLVGNQVVATFSGGKKGSTLSVHFNASATQGQVQTVLRSVAFKSTSKVPGNRTLKLQIRNIGSVNSNPAEKTVQVGP